MGLLINGQWHDKWYETKDSDGRFVRKDASFRGQITADGSSGFKAEKDRYHLYVSHACPWANRTMIFRKIKDLEGIISHSVVHPLMLEDGWTFQEGQGTSPDTVHGARLLHQVYTRARPDYTGRVTVPVLWDKQTDTIVNNESSEIIRIFNSAFNGLTGNTDDYWPKELREEIEVVNDRIYDTVNNGVYKAGFATTQEAYEEAAVALFETLDWLEDRLKDQRYLMGARLTEADWRLFTTLIRFDPVYHGHFKCNLRRLVEYPSLWAYTRDLYQHPGVKDTVHFDHIKRHYYYSHETVNPTRIVPIGPEIDYEAPHGRERLGRG